MTMTIESDHPLSILEVAHSKFLGFVRNISSRAQADSLQKSLKLQYPEAAHVPVAWPDGFDEDGEPPNSCGPAMQHEIGEKDLAVVVVRFFGNKLLGVTCGRLTQCYASVTKLALHRFLHPGRALEQEILDVKTNVYGLAAGDTELILNVAPDSDLLSKVSSELEWFGFQGSLGEELPRQQNLQADTSQGIVPVYRYPGNYRGDEWETYEWSPTSLQIKQKVEDALLPLIKQEMNHCVANLYRNGDDFIAHHSDKDLDVDKEGVIVSVSLGEARILELRRRAEPRDVTRMVLPHGSMLVLGPNTNRLFTHSVLKKEGSTAPRLSLTLRRVTTFMDMRSGRLFGQGVPPKSIQDLRKQDYADDCLCVVGAGALAAWMFPKRGGLKWGGVVLGVAAFCSFRFVRKAMRRRGEEKDARDFFSRTSVSGTRY